MKRIADALPVLFLWHHHQPFYLPPGADYPLMPWVRLHAVRGYADMAAAAVDYQARVTFNFSPCLLEQLQAAATANTCDAFEQVSRIPAADLTERDKRFLLTHFFSINWTVHVRPHARYASLLAKRGEVLSDETLKRALMDFGERDYRDLIALFNLIWIGFAGRRDPVIAELIAKRQDYTESDIAEILRFHRTVLRGIISQYRDLSDQGLIELAVSPYSHAILPLLCNSGAAAPDIPRPRLPRPDYCFPEDAQRQIRLACELYAAVWQAEPAGMWPSEGAVSGEALRYVAEAGFRWAATDQAILERSEHRHGGNHAHFFPYEFRPADNALRLYFRDRALSDAIGFRYATMLARDAVRDFIGNLERVEADTRDQAGRCAVIALDGENPWEAYPDGGEQFLAELYGELSRHPRLGLSTFTEHVGRGTRERITRLHAGSWIDSDFHIWIGDPEKNAAWSELYRARQAVADVRDQQRYDECQRWLLRAQGSDWFWWYGEPFHSAYDAEFDGLFRAYLRAVYLAAGREIPATLEMTLRKPPPPARRMQPTFPIVPHIDGCSTSYYEWAGACRIDPLQHGVVMGRSERFLSAVYYAFGETAVYFRFDVSAGAHLTEHTRLRLHVLGAEQATVALPLLGPRRREDHDGVCWAVDRVFEVEVRLERIGLDRGQECRFWLEIDSAGEPLEKLPPEGVYRFMIPTPDMVASNWMV